MLEVNESLIDKLTESLYLLLNGKKANFHELPPDYPDNEIKQLVEYFNRFTSEFNEFSGFMYSLSRGELDYDPPKGKLEILQAFKSLQANLKHLTWKTQQIAKGDFSHKVDFMGDFSEAFNEMTRQLKESFEQIQEQNRQLVEANHTIEYERSKIDALLRNILPDKVVEELEDRGTTTPQLYHKVVVFFSDIVGFTNKSSEIDPPRLIQELSSLFAVFDCIVDATYGERIKTIGDAYLAVWGMHNSVTNPAEIAVESAIRMLDYLKERNLESELQWEIRIGIHIGDVVGGIVGTSKFIYDIFGDTVNIASRMESNSEAMRINVSEDMYNLVSHKFTTTKRGMLNVKGKGNVNMYFINEKKAP